MKIIIARSMYHDQFTTSDDLVGVFTDETKARKCRDSSSYVRLFEVEPNTQPMKLTEIKP